MSLCDSKTTPLFRDVGLWDWKPSSGKKIGPVSNRGTWNYGNYGVTAGHWLNNSAEGEKA